MTVGYTTVTGGAAGTAKANTDFTPETGTTTFAFGSPTAIISVPIFGNGVYNNPDLTFSVELTGVTNVVGPPVTFAQAGSNIEQGATSVAVGDLNGDGLPDLVIANGPYGTVSVLLSTTTPGGAPTFAAPVSFGVGGGTANSVAVADLNGDGKPDVIVADQVNGLVVVLLNKTPTGLMAPTFAAPGQFDVGAFPVSVAVADLNGDGMPDVITANYLGDNVSVLMNTTTPGSLTPMFNGPTNFNTGKQPFGVAVGDFNGDGKLDLAVANFGDSTASVLLNATAPGSLAPKFAPQATFAVDLRARAIAVGDLNGDGEPDIVVGDQGSSLVAVLVNTTAPGATTASFAPQQPFTVGSQPISLAVADVNGDGKPDIVSADNGAGGLYGVSVLLNQTQPGAAATSFAPEITYPGSYYLRSIAIADLNGDGQPDLVAVGRPSGPSGYLLVLRNTTALGAAPITPSFPMSGTAAVSSPPVSVAVGDLNGDGKPDLVVALPSSNSVAVLLNTTAPGATMTTFAPAVNFAAGANASAVAIADVNGDGMPDLIVVYSPGISVLLNATPAGSLTPVFDAAVAVDSLPNIYALTVADFTGDGKPDIAVALQGGDASSAYAVILTNSTLPGATSPSFDTEVFYSVGSNVGSAPTSIAAADLNGDGKPDLVVTVHYGAASYASVLLNTTPPGAPAASFSGFQKFAPGSTPEFVAVADLNGDGMPDLIIADEADNTVSVLLNLTAPGSMQAKFAGQVAFATGMAPDFVAVADVNGDGKPDVLVADRSADTVSVLLNTTPPGAAAPTFATASDFAAGAMPFALAVGDFNGDGRPDFAVADYSSNYTSVLLNTPETIINAAAVGTITESDPPPTVQFSVAAETVNASAGTFSITVALSAVSGDDTTIPFTLGGTAVNGTDYGGATASPLVIPAGQTSGVITGTLFEDGGPNKTLTLTLGTPTNAALGGTTTNTLTIDEPAVFATTLVFLQAPSSATTLQPISPDVLVQVLDQDGIPVTSGTVTISVASGSSGGFDSASTVTVAVNSSGVADFNNLILDLAGTYSLTASYGALSASSPSFTASGAALTLAPDGFQTTNNVPRIPVGVPFFQGGFFADYGNVPLQAIVSWGDGYTTNVPVDVANQVGRFVTNHAYSQEGTYPLSVTIENDQGQVVTVAALPGPVQVTPAQFGPVIVIYGVPGQTVSQYVTDPSTGATIDVDLTLPAGDASGGYLLVTELIGVQPQSRAEVLQYLASFEIRQFNLPADATASVTFVVTGYLPSGTTGELLFLDKETDPSNPTEKPFQGSPQFFGGPNVKFGLNQFTTPRLGDLSGTVFSVAASIPGSTATAVVSAPVVSAALEATAPVQTATFRTTTTLTLTLEPSQAGQVSSGLSMLSTNNVGGGGTEEDPSAANALLQFLFEELDFLPKVFSYLEATDASPAATSPATAAPTPAGPPVNAAPGEMQGSQSALDLFLHDQTPTFGWSEPTLILGEIKAANQPTRIEGWNPLTPANKTAAYAVAAAGAIFYISEREKRRKGRNLLGGPGDESPF